MYSFPYIAAVPGSCPLQLGVVLFDSLVDLYLDTKSWIRDVKECYDHIYKSLKSGLSIFQIHVIYVYYTNKYIFQYLIIQFTNIYILCALISNSWKNVDGLWFYFALIYIVFTLFSCGLSKLGHNILTDDHYKQYFMASYSIYARGTLIVWSWYLLEKKKKFCCQGICKKYTIDFSSTRNWQYMHSQNVTL